MTESGAAVELKGEPSCSSKASFDASRKIGPAVIAEARRRGLVTRGRGDTIYLGPALVMQPRMVKKSQTPVGTVPRHLSPGQGAWVV